MKIRMGELRRIIREEAGAGIVELMDDPQAAARSWPNVTWNGRSVVDELYPIILAKFDIRKRGRGWDGQEVYLGYVPGDDSFVMGWDAFPPGEDEGMTSAWQHFSLDVSLGQITEPEPEGEMQIGAPGLSFYARGEESGHNLVKQQFPGIIDLRLD